MVKPVRIITPLQELWRIIVQLQLGGTISNTYLHQLYAGREFPPSLQQTPVKPEEAAKPINKEKKTNTDKDKDNAVTLDISNSPVRGGVLSALPDKLSKIISSFRHKPWWITVLEVVVFLLLVVDMAYVLYVYHSDKKNVVKSLSEEEEKQLTVSLWYYIIFIVVSVVLWVASHLTGLVADLTQKVTKVWFLFTLCYGDDWANFALSLVNQFFVSQPLEVLGVLHPGKLIMMWKVKGVAYWLFVAKGFLLYAVVSLITSHRRSATD